MSEKIQALIELILGLDPKEEAHFTKNQLPDSRVLGEKLGEAVSAAERDEAFTAFAEQHPEKAAEFREALNSPAEDEPVAAPTKAGPSEMITGQDAIKHLRGKGHKI